MAKYDQQWYRDFYGRYLTSFVMIIFLLLNVLFFISQMILGNRLTDSGALITDNVYYGGQLYRLITATFLHADISHIVSNVIGLFFIGGLIEISVGHIGFALIYLVSGIGGNLVSVYYENFKHIERYSIGASGGVFGLIGALLILTAYERIRSAREGKPVGSLLYRGLFVVVFMVASGFTEGGVNNTAHIGGLIMGMIVCTALVLIRGSKIKPMQL